MSTLKMTARWTMLIAVLGSCFLTAGCPMDSFDGRRDDAKKVWDRTRANIKCQLAENKLKHGKLEKAGEILAEVLADVPENVKAHMLMGKVLLNQGRFAAAGMEFRFVLSKNEKAHEAHYLLATCFQRLKRSKKALEHYARAAELATENPAYLIANAEALVACKRVREACRLLEGRLEDFADSVPVLSAASQMHNISGDDKRAAQLATRVLEIEPENQRAGEMLAVSLCRMGRHDDAVPVLLEIVERDKDKAATSMLVMLADCYTRLGELTQAAGYLQQACRKKEVASGVRLQLAKVFVLMDEPDLALGAVRAALRREPANADAQAMRGVLLIEMGKPKKAAAHLGDAVRRHPSDTTLRMLLGRALSRMGRTRAAVVEYERVLADDPDDALAKALLAELQPKPKPAVEPEVEPETEDDEEDGIGFED